MRKVTTSPSRAEKAEPSPSPPLPPSGAIPRERVVWPLSRLRHPNDPHRDRIDAARVVALAQDIAVNGLLNPILIRGPLEDGTAEVIAGDRRTYAYEHLKREAIEAFLYPSTTAVLDIRAAENLFHEPLDPVAEGRIAARYLEKGDPLPVIAARMGHSVTWVEDRLAIIGYPADVREAIARGDIGVGVAAVLVGIEHEGVRGELLAEAIRTGATRRQADVWLAHWRSDGARMAANHVAVEQIVREAEAYRVVVQCEGCARDTEITKTTTLRFCFACLDEVRKAASE